MDYCILLIWITYKQTTTFNTALVSFKHLNDAIKLITNTNTVNVMDSQIKTFIQISVTTLKYCGCMLFLSSRGKRTYLAIVITFVGSSFWVLPHSTGSFPRVKRSGRGADHPPPSSAEERKSRAIPLPHVWAFGSVTGYLYLLPHSTISNAETLDTPLETH
jgi:hypothetical protein